NARNELGSTALIRSSDPEVSRLLLDHGANINLVNKFGDTALTLAGSFGQTKVVRFLLERGADVRIGDMAFALGGIAYTGDVSLLKEMIEKGADVNARVKEDGSTALHTASSVNQVEAARLLLDKGAIVDARNREGRTPLSFAAQSGSPAMVALL